MITPKFFYNLLIRQNINFFAGVPDSLLKYICAYITDHTDENAHFIAANEGCAVGLAAGYHLATGKIPLIYMQNSGLGNAVNPLLSLVDPRVYRIPLVLLIGWRGEPGVHDEPQHVAQGEVTPALCTAMGIPYVIMASDEQELTEQMASCYRDITANSGPFAFIVRKGTFTPYTLEGSEHANEEMTREEAIEEIMLAADVHDLFVVTTGMASRELYELRKKHGMSHTHDFLTVGSMGHASQIALTLALYRSNNNVLCIDGDGACIMHMGGLTTIGTRKPPNLRHIVINNGAHDSVGGQPTTALQIDLPAIAHATGYERVLSVKTRDALRIALSERKQVTTFIEILVRRGARSDLGRPLESPTDNKTTFMNYLTSDQQ